MSVASIKNDLLPWVIYPAVMLLGVFSHLWLMQLQSGFLLSTYLPVISGALLITVFEYWLPYRQAWRPPWYEVRNDLLYMVLVQIGVPRLLSFSVALMLLRLLEGSDTGFGGIWVHDWPIGFQVALMLISAEFLRYWVHRLAHVWSPLWRLHAIHHSPDKLYWLNTGRFHPLEKALQFLFDALPFIILGVSAEVLALYFVFYAINGFFQHSNIKLKFGFLNYLISSAELHRWHHARDIKESGSNYGNNLIIWDIVFGSFFLPADREVNKLGVFNANYPTSIWQQLQTPFTPGVDKKDIPLMGVLQVWQNIKVQCVLRFFRLFYYMPFVSSLNNPLKIQQALLKRIVHDNENTDFGKQYGFNNIENHQHWAANVAIQDYESLRPFIDKQQENLPALTRQMPLYYAMTSGTTGLPKLIPVVKETLQSQQRALAIFACVQNAVQRHSFSGALLAIHGSYEEGRLENGTVYGAVAGLLYRAMPAVFKKKYLLPESVFDIKDYVLKYRVIVRLALQEKNITYTVSANPSTYLKLLEVLNSGFAKQCDEIENGSFSELDKLPSQTRNEVEKCIKADPQRASELRLLSKPDKPVTLADIWPNLRLIVTWTGGSCGVAINSLKKNIPVATRILELGYLASELRGTITLEDTGNAGVPALQDAFFEFIEIGEYEQDVRQTKTLDQLATGSLYYVIITTPAGLYRYFMNDIVEVTGWKKNTPLLRFVQKGKGITNITGEKLSEQQLIQAVDKATQTLGIHCTFYIALAFVEQAHYQLYIEVDGESAVDVERLSMIIDDALRQLNLEYDSKRASDRLKPLEVKQLDAGTSEQYKLYCLDKGQRESQYKTLLLIYRSDCNFSFDACCK